jgi:hypothetical protein
VAVEGAQKSADASCEFAIARALLAGEAAAERVGCLAGGAFAREFAAERCAPFGAALAALVGQAENGDGTDADGEAGGEREAEEGAAREDEGLAQVRADHAALSHKAARGGDESVKHARRGSGRRRR